MQQHNYIGIDIGLNGAIVYRDINNDTIKEFKIPILGKGIDVHFLFDIVKNIVDSDLSKYNCKPVIVFEKLGLIFKSSKATAFSMGFQLGIIEMICVALGLTYYKVSAKEWQKFMFLGISEIKKANDKRDTKAMALLKAKQLWPDKKFVFKDSRAKKDHDGIIDALLISEYARRNNL